MGEWSLPRPVIDLFIIVYLFIAWAWRQPAGTFGHAATAPLGRMIRWWGLGQTWSMFTPDPAVAKSRLQVVVRLASGGAVMWEPPRLDDLSRWNAFRCFRYRAYASAMMSPWAERARPTLARYLLRKYDFTPDAPVDVVFTRVEWPIAPPGHADVCAPEVRSVLYTFAVSEREPW